MRRISEAARERALAVQAAMDAGVPRQEIADAAGVHRVNVYKLLNALDEKN